MRRPASGGREATMLAAATACLAAPALVAADFDSPVTVLAVVFLFALAPGAALVPLLAPGTKVPELGLIVGTSLALTTLIAQSMLWIDVWRPTLATYGVAGLCLPFVVAHLLQGRLRLSQ